MVAWLLLCLLHQRDTPHLVRRWRLLLLCAQGVGGFGRGVLLLLWHWRPACIAPADRAQWRWWLLLLLSWVVLPLLLCVVPV
jgi:hypothetical protein